MKAFLQEAGLIVWCIIKALYFVLSAASFLLMIVLIIVNFWQK